MPSLILTNPQLRQALGALAHKAPRGLESLNSLPDDTLLRALTWPDEVKPVTRVNHLIELPEVDAGGYSVYDGTFTLAHVVEVDPLYPDIDLTVPQSRTMQFGSSIMDLDFMLDLNHGDIFYIGWKSNSKPPRTLMVINFDPLVP